MIDVVNFKLETIKNHLNFHAIASHPSLQATVILVLAGSTTSTYPKISKLI